MYSIEDKNQLVSDLKSAAQSQDGRQVSRLAGHGVDLKIISATKASTLRSLAFDLYNSNWKSGKDCAAAIVEYADTI